MRPLEKSKRKELDGIIDELTQIKGKINSKQAEINGMIVDLNDDIQKYNNVLKNMEAFASKITTDFEDYQKEHNRDWDSTSAGQSHSQAHSKWETIDLQPVDQVDEIEVMDNLTHPDDISGLPVPR